MKTIFPKKKLNWQNNKELLPEIPSKTVGNSGWLMIAAAQKGFDMYVVFTNSFSSQIWIEKASLLNTQSDHLVTEMLQRIDDDSEFVQAHQHFIKEGILDDIYTPKKP